MGLQDKKIDLKKLRASLGLVTLCRFYQFNQRLVILQEVKFFLSNSSFIFSGFAIKTISISSL